MQKNHHGVASFLSQENHCEYVQYMNIIQYLTQPYSVEVTFIYTKLKPKTQNVPKTQT